MYGLADNLTISPSGHPSIINEIVTAYFCLLVILALHSFSNPKTSIALLLLSSPFALCEHNFFLFFKCGHKNIVAARQQ